MAHIKYMAAKDIDGISSETGKKLRGQKKVRVTIVSARDDDVWEGGINGHFFRFPCNVSIDIPEDLAKIIEQSRKVIREKEKLEKKLSSKEGMKVEV